MSQTAGYFQYYDSAGRDLKIKGIDISTAGAQYPMNWTTAYNAGVRFVYMKCSQRLTVKDAGFTAVNIAAARSAGIKVGAYHFSQPSQIAGGGTVANAQAEADWFTTKLQEEFGSGLYGDLIPMFDFEDASTTWADDDTAYDYIEAFINRFKANTGRQAILYTAYYYIDGNITGTADLSHSTKGYVGNICPLWVAAKTPDLAENQPPSSYPNYNFTKFGGFTDDKWLLWQFSSDGNGDGATYGANSTDIDIDVLEGALYTIMPPSQVTGVTATPHNGAVSLIWTATEADTIQYKIYVDTVYNQTVSAGQTAATVTGLTNGVEYDFQVSAIDKWDEGAKSAIVSSTPSTDLIVGVIDPIKAFTGNDVYFVDVTAAGDEFLNDGNTVLYIKNDSASPIDVTLQSVELDNFGYDHDPVITVANGTITAIGAFNQFRFNNKISQRMKVTYSASASVKIMVVSYKPF